MQFKKSGETSSGLAFTRKTEQESSPLTKLGFRKEQHKAEILGALKSVMTHFSYSSACDIVDAFKAMFTDCNIAQGMSFGPGKLSYLITFGIVPYFRQSLVEDLKMTQMFCNLMSHSIQSFMKNRWTDGFQCQVLQE